MNRVVIEIDGGCVSDVYSDTPCAVFIIDRDAEEVGEDGQSSFDTEAGGIPPSILEELGLQPRPVYDSFQYHILQPGDATLYTVAYGLMQIPLDAYPRLFFAFGVGNHVGGFIIADPVSPAMSYAYFTDKVSGRIVPKTDKHTLYVAFYALHHLLGTEPFESDRYDRIDEEFKPGWLSALPTYEELRASLTS